MVEFRFESDNDVQVARRLIRFADAARDATPAFVDLRDLFVSAMDSQFDSEGGYGAGGWAPLSPRYAAWKQQQYPGRGILEATGALRDSLTTSLDVNEVGPRSMTVGSRVRYGRYHQSRRPRRTSLPRRAPVALPESWRRDAVRIMQRWLLAAARGGGL